jgi:hypothetical protein
MKHLLLPIALTLALNTSGQQLSFKNSPVDTLVIASGTGYYHFDKRGTSTGLRDEYILAFDKKQNSYRLNQYRRTRYKSTIKPETYREKAKVLQQGRPVDRLLLANLLDQFDTTYVQLTFQNIGLSSEEFLQLTDERHIRQVAKWNGVDWKFKSKFSDKEDNAALFKGCQNADTLNVYLATNFEMSGYPIVSDYYEEFNVYITTPEQRFRFEGKYPNAIKQPWYKHADSSAILPATILNFSINAAIDKLLPRRFSCLGSLQFESLMNRYIKWYLERRGIILL